VEIIAEDKKAVEAPDGENALGDAKVLSEGPKEAQAAAKKKAQEAKKASK
jgi:hypothetical protein